jgi:hypothetical protein
MIQNSISSLAAQRLDEIQDPEDLGGVTRHVPVPRLSPSERAVSIHDERGAVGHIPRFVQHPVGADHDAVNVAQEREGKTLRPGKLGVTRGAVAADGEELGPALA